MHAADHRQRVANPNEEELQSLSGWAIWAEPTLVFRQPAPSDLDIAAVTQHIMLHETG
jgi:hypothetical protein